MEGATDEDIICRLRQRTVPEGYSYHYWCPGKSIIHINDFLILYVHALQVKQKIHWKC